MVERGPRRALSGLCLPLQAVISLMEMGFDEKEVMDALRVNNNQQNAAVSTAVGAPGRRLALAAEGDAAWDPVASGSSRGPPVV